MDIQTILTILGIISTLALSGIALYKAFKTVPKEIKSADVDLSIKYEGLLKSALIRSQELEAKLKDMEKQVDIYERKIEEHEDEIKSLHGIVQEHEKEIKRLTELIVEKEVDMAILRKKILSQDVDIIALKEVIEKDNNIEKT
jgi:peptidoglycan hydrolase CwlO-like protein